MARFFGGGDDRQLWLDGAPGVSLQLRTRATSSDAGRILTPAQALAALRRAVAAGAVTLARLHGQLAARGRGLVVRGTGDVWAELAATLERGQLVVVAHRRSLSPLGHEPDLLEAPAPAPVDEPLAEQGHTLRLILVEDDGRPLPGAALTLDPPDAKAKPECFSGADGSASFEDRPPGRHRLRLSDLEQADWHVDPPQEGPPPWPGQDDAEARVVEIALGLELALASDVRDGVAVDVGPLNWVVLGRPVLRRVIPEILRCDHGSALLMPAPWTDHRHPLAALVQACLALLEDPARWLLVVGHASTSGSAAGNQALSEVRAAVVRTLLEGDGAGWVALAREHGSLRDVIAYLAYLGDRRGWACVCERPPGDWRSKANHDSRALIEAFQGDYNARVEAGELAPAPAPADTLVCDGVCGPRTLAAIFAVLRHELIRWLDKFGRTPDELPLGRIVYRGHGSALAGRGGPADDPEAGDRLVELFVVEGLPFDPALDLEPIYDSRIPRRPSLALPDEPNEWTTGPFTILSDLTPGEPAAPERYRLRADDGWVQETILPDEGELSPVGELTIHYPELSTARRYTLVVIAEDGHESEIFSDLRYGQLHRSVRES